MEISHLEHTFEEEYAQKKSMILDDKPMSKNFYLKMKDTYSVIFTSMFQSANLKDGDFIDIVDEINDTSVVLSFYYKNNLYQYVNCLGLGVNVVFVFKN